jgi:hypothetical protein
MQNKICSVTTKFFIARTNDVLVKTKLVASLQNFF